MASYSRKTDKTPNNDLLVKLDGFFRAALDHPTWIQWRTDAVKCFKYKEGDQWTTEELGVLGDRGQAPSVNNQISVTINRLVGQFVKFKTRLAFRGRNAPQDEPLAQAYTDIFRFIAQNSDLEYEEREMADDGFTAGFGVLETQVVFGEDHKPEILIKHEDCFNILPDPYSRKYDWNEDARFIHRSKWANIDDAKELYPGSATELDGVMHDVGAGLLGDVEGFKRDNYIDDKYHRVRLVETWWKTREKETIMLFTDGSVVDHESLVLTKSDGSEVKLTKAQHKELMARDDYEEIDRLKSSMHKAVWSGGVLFEHKELDRDRFPFVPYFVQRKKDGEPYSLILLAIPMQDQINKRESKALHLLNTNQTLYQQNGIPDVDKFIEEKAKPDGMLEVRNIEQVKIERNLELAVTQFNMHNQAKEDFRRITGINPDALGEPSEVRSGVGIARKVAMTDLIIAPVFDNLRRTRVNLAKNVLELVQKYYTEPKVFAITDDLNQTKVVTLNQKADDIKQRVYDVVADEVPDIATLQQEQAAQLQQTLPNILQFGPGWAELFIQMSDLRNKEDLIKRVQQMGQPPPTEPKIAISAQLDNLTAIERAFFYQKMGSPELAQAIIQLNPPQTALLEEQANAGEAQVKAQADAAKMKMDMAGKQADLQMKGQSHAMDMQAKREKMDMDREKAAMDMRTKAVSGVVDLEIKREDAKIRAANKGNTNKSR